MPSVTGQLAWTEWVPLQGASRLPDVPQAPGLYRIRRGGRHDLDYIGQTSQVLRRRLGFLRGIYSEEMPYSEPHTAAPALWALRHATGCDFELSVAVVEGSISWRKGMEAVAIALYRQENGVSPTVEFGRFPAGYRPSLGNARLAASGKGLRGGIATQPHERHQPGIRPFGPLGGDSQSGEWGGHRWTNWIDLREPAAPITRGSGLYRIRGDDGYTLLYVGQGRIPDRPLAHLTKALKPLDPQGSILERQRRLECSWIINEAWLSHQRLEIENDLIAAHILETGELPAAQFLG